VSNSAITPWIPGGAECGRATFFPHCVIPHKAVTSRIYGYKQTTEIKKYNKKENLTFILNVFQMINPKVCGSC
jgi:hypothetical protein